MTIQELFMSLVQVGEIRDVETQRIDYDDSNDEPQSEPVAPTYAIYLESMTNRQVIGLTIEVSESLYNQLKPSLKFPEPIEQVATRTIPRLAN
jgi:PhoPQ-activated pathogenicity-related protein